MKNIAFVLSYDGTRYFGWQKTPLRPTVEGELTRVLEKVLQHPVTLQAASRTDRGVHAKGQVVNFFTDRDGLDLKKLLTRINSLLPKDIQLLSLYEEEDEFHPTISASHKCYLYQVFYGEVLVPYKRHYFYHFRYPLDLAKIERAKEFFIGKRDFSALSNIRVEDGTREIFSIDIEKQDKELYFHIMGDRFLYKMARNLVGTLLYIGSGKITLEEAKEILPSKDRKKAGVTAPASGLFLNRVFYPDKTLISSCSN